MDATPARTMASRLFYTFFHPEPVQMGEDPLQDGLPERDRDPFDSNQAIPTLLFERQRQRFNETFPTLTVTRVEHYSFLAYPLSGGFRKWSLVPARLVAPLLAFENRIAPWLARLFGFRMLAVVQRTGA